MNFKLIQVLSDIVPDGVRTSLRLMGFQKILSIFINKSEGELIYQFNWVKKFKNNKGKVKEYWSKYLYLGEVNKICNFDSNTKVLDVGCGISTVLHFIKGKKYGIDPLADEYKKIYDYPKDISIQKGVGEQIPYRKSFFDVVFCSNVLDHTDNPKAVIKEISRVLKKGGYFVLTIHIFNKSFKRDPAHPHTFTRKDVYSLTGACFRPVFQKISPAIGFYDYVTKGIKKSKIKELVLMFKNVMINL